jgi:hypothetical protein
MTDIQTVTNDGEPVIPPVDQTAEPVVGSEPSAEPVQTPEPAPQGKPDETPAWMKAEITKERNRRRRAEEETQQLKDQVDRLTRAVGERAEKPASSEKPNRGDFFDPDEYEAAKDAWLIQEAEKRIEAKTTRAQQEQDQQRQTEEIRKSWSAQVESAKKAHPDFEEVVYSDDFQCTPVMMNAIAADIHGAEVAYHLATDPDEASRIAALAPVQQIIEIGRLSATLQAKPAVEPRRAPAPITPLGNEAPADRKSPAEESEAEYFARRNAEAKANRERLF